MKPTFLASAIALAFGAGAAWADQGNDKSTGDLRGNSGGAGASGTGAAVANNGSTSTANFSNAFNTSKALAMSKLSGTVSNITTHGIGNVASNTGNANGAADGIGGTGLGATGRGGASTGGAPGNGGMSGSGGAGGLGSTGGATGGDAGSGDAGSTASAGAGGMGGTGHSAGGEGGYGARPAATPRRAEHRRTAPAPAAAAAPPHRARRPPRRARPRAPGRHGDPQVAAPPVQPAPVDAGLGGRAAPPPPDLQGLNQRINEQVQRLAGLRRSLEREEAGRQDLRRALGDRLLDRQRGGTGPGTATAAVNPAAVPVGAAPDPNVAPNGAVAATADGRLATVAPIFEEPGVLSSRGHYVLEPSLQYSYSSNNRLTLLGYTIIPSLLIGLVDVREVNRNTTVAALTGRFGVAHGRHRARGALPDHPGQRRAALPDRRPALQDTHRRRPVPGRDRLRDPAASATPRPPASR